MARHAAFDLVRVSDTLPRDTDLKHKGVAMGFWNGAGKVVSATVILTSKPAMGGAKLAGKGIVATGQALYGNREQIGKAASAVTKATVTTVAVAGYGTYK